MRLRQSSRKAEQGIVSTLSPVTVDYTQHIHKRVSMVINQDNARIRTVQLPLPIWSSLYPDYPPPTLSLIRTKTKNYTETSGPRLATFNTSLLVSANIVILPRMILVLEIVGRRP